MAMTKQPEGVTRTRTGSDKVDDATGKPVLAEGWRLFYQGEPHPGEKREIGEVWRRPGNKWDVLSAYHQPREGGSPATGTQRDLMGYMDGLAWLKEEHLAHLRRAAGTPPMAEGSRAHERQHVKVVPDTDHGAAGAGGGQPAGPAEPGPGTAAPPVQEAVTAPEQDERDEESPATVTASLAGLEPPPAVLAWRAERGEIPADVFSNPFAAPPEF